jgi:hypothetical protein
VRARGLVVTATPPPRRFGTRALTSGLAAILSFESRHAHAAPSARDIAYEQGVQAEEAGDHARAAAEFARAYALTPASEAGPRLLFLRASVTARQRAASTGGDLRENLCPARSLLREHLAGSPPGPGPDPLSNERASLVNIEQDLGAIDCDAPSEPPPADVPPVPEDRSSLTTPLASAPADQRHVSENISPPAPPSTDPRRPLGLRIAGATSLAVGAAALVPMSVGIALGRAATREGLQMCWDSATACDGTVPLSPLNDLADRGRRADHLVKISAPIAGVFLLAGIILLTLAKPVRPRRTALVPQFGPRALGLGLHGRF